MTALIVTGKRPTRLRNYIEGFKPGSGKIHAAKYSWPSFRNKVAVGKPVAGSNLFWTLLTLAQPSEKWAPLPELILIFPKGLLRSYKGYIQLHTSRTSGAEYDGCFFVIPWVRGLNSPFLSLLFPLVYEDSRRDSFQFSGVQNLE